MRENRKFYYEDSYNSPTPNCYCPGFVMDVTVHNFRAALALLRNFLPGASFVSFDLEFTGLGESRPSQLDTPQSRYTDARSDVAEYVPIQFGLTIFRRQENNRWLVLPFNFNLAPGAVYYPQNSRYPLIDRTFSLQGSTVAFLIQHGFDFDKCLRLGVSWLSRELETELTRHVKADLHRRQEERLEKKNADGDIKRLTAQLSDRIVKFMKNAESDPENPDRQVAVLPLSRSRIARAHTLRYIRLNYSRVVGETILTPEGTRLRLQLHKTEEEASAHRDEALLNDVDNIVSRAVGFRYVVDLMLEARVPLVVHNGLIDITKLYGTFVGELPDALQDFKRIFRKAFPIIYDTKLLVQELASQDTCIQEATSGKRLDLSKMVSSFRDIAKGRGLVTDFEMFIPVGRVSDRGRLADAKVVSDERFVIRVGEPSNREQDPYQFGRYSSGEFGHEAGFDSMQTGYLFSLISTLMEKTGGESSLNSLEGKILLASCGGYQWVDFASVEEDEVNRWFEKEVFIVSRSSTQDGRLEAKSTLDKVFKGTKYEETKRDVIFAGPNACMVILDVEKLELSDDTLSELEAKARQTGVDICRYRPEFLSHPSIIKNKKRKFGDRR